MCKCKGTKALKACYGCRRHTQLDFLDGPPISHIFDRGRPPSTAARYVHNARVTTVTRTLRLQWERYFRRMRQCPAVHTRSYTLGCVRIRSRCAKYEKLADAYAASGRDGGRPTATADASASTVCTSLVILGLYTPTFVTQHKRNAR